MPEGGQKGAGGAGKTAPETGVSSSANLLDEAAPWDVGSAGGKSSVRGLSLAGPKVSLAERFGASMVAAQASMMVSTIRE